MGEDRSLTADAARELFSYDPETGIVTRKTGRCGTKPGDIVGSINSNGYLLVSIDSVRYRLHRVIWLMMTGEWPVEVDHIDRDRTNNKWSNLRNVSSGENQRNKGPEAKGKSGYKCVYHRKRDGWMFEFRADGKFYRGYGFQSPREAHAAYRETSQKVEAALRRGMVPSPSRAGGNTSASARCIWPVLHTPHEGPYV